MTVQMYGNGTTKQNRHHEVAYRSHAPGAVWDQKLKGNSTVVVDC